MDPHLPMLDSNTLINVFNSDADSDGEDRFEPHHPLIEAARACDIDALRRALAEGRDVNYREPDSGATPFAHLLRAGARIPTQFIVRSEQDPLPSHYKYLTAVAAAGGFIPYERAHRTRLAAIFIPKFPQLPAEVVHHILPFWADVGGR